MDGHFSVLTIITQSSVADRTCERLEEAGIPVMLEHVEISYGPQVSHGYRLLVPSTMHQNAMSLISLTSLEPYPHIH